MRLYQRKEGGNWWLEINHNGQKRRSLKTKKKQSAKKLARKILARVEAGGSFHDDQEPTPELIANLLEEYEAELLRRGNKKGSIQDCVNAIAHCCLRSNLEFIDELDTKTLEKALGKMTNIGPRTKNKYLGHFKSWFKWMVLTERHHENPALRIRRVKEVNKKERRPLNSEELERLTTSEFIPEYRRVLYTLAAYTGLRRSELASITWADVDIRAGTITIRAENSKNAKAFTIPLNEDAAKIWRAWLNDPWAKIGDEVYVYNDPVPPVPKMWTYRNDLAHACIEEESADGVVDFHSLRLTFATMMARAEVPLTMAQKLMRHSTPVLTANIYTKFAPKDLAEAVAKLSKKKKPLDGGEEVAK